VSVRRLFSIASQTVFEILRARLMYVLAVLLVVLAWSSLFLGDIAIEPKAEVAVDLGVSGAALICGIMTILISLEYAGAAVRPVFYPFLAAGVGRGMLLAGRWLGVVLVTTALAALVPVCIMTAIALTCEITPGNAQDLAAAVLLLPLETLVLASITVFFAVYAVRPVALALAIALWLICHMQINAPIYEPDAMDRLVIVFSRLLPDLELYNPRLFFLVTPPVFVGTLAQTAFYSLAALYVAALYYRTKDL